MQKGEGRESEREEKKKTGLGRNLAVNEEPATDAAKSFKLLKRSAHRRGAANCERWHCL